MSDNTIFMGSEAFDKLTKSIGVVCKCRATIYRGVRYELNEMLEPSKCVTMDEDLVEILKDLELKNE